VQIAAQAASGNGLTLYFIALLLGLSWGGGVKWGGVYCKRSLLAFTSRAGTNYITRRQLAGKPLTSWRQMCSCSG